MRLVFTKLFKRMSNTNNVYIIRSITPGIVLGIIDGYNLLPESTEELSL